ncbi:MAG: tetratricopeptide repeat protein [Rhodobacteraceae bacterium]|nr:MAG: tetratricopeptide repeat protein [Paracoccaceae bacterium]
MIANVLAATAVAACLAGGPAAARETLTGSYLAARHAHNLNDVEAAARYFSAALRRDRDNPRLMEHAALNLIAAGRIDAAEPIAARLVDADPANRIGNLSLAVAEIAAGDFARARGRLADRGDGFYPLLGRLIEAWAAFGEGDLAGAEATLASLDDRTVFRLFSGYHLGLVRSAAGDHAGAVEAFETALGAVGAPPPRLAAAYGIALERAGRPTDAARAFDDGPTPFGDPLLAAERARLQAGNPPAVLVETAAEGAAEALHGFAGVFGGESGRRLALAYARLALHLRPDLDVATLLVGELLRADGQHASALAAFNAVPEDSKHASRARIAAAGELLDLGRAAEAIEGLEALIAAEPEAPQPRIALGDLLRREQAWEPCIDAYAAAIDLLDGLGIENWALFYQRGICHERAGVWDPAEADFRRALALEPDQPLVLNYLGYSLVELRRNLDEAKAMIKRAVELRPDDGYITDSLGWVLYRLGDYEGAVEWLEKAVALAPVDPVINDHLGDALWMVGRRVEAEFQWRRARSFDPEPDDLARIKRKLDVGLDVVLLEEAKGVGSTVAAPADAPAPNDG